MLNVKKMSQILQNLLSALRQKCPYSEFSRSVFSGIQTEYRPG